jgi:hypothetical protein
MAPTRMRKAASWIAMTVGSLVAIKIVTVEVDVGGIIFNAPPTPARDEDPTCCPAFPAASTLGAPRRGAAIDRLRRASAVPTPVGPLRDPTGRWCTRSVTNFQGAV